MSSNTPGYPGGYSNYPPQSDQGYGADRPPTAGGARPPMAMTSSLYGAARRPRLTLLPLRSTAAVEIPAPRPPISRAVAF